MITGPCYFLKVFHLQWGVPAGLVVVVKVRTGEAKERDQEKNTSVGPVHHGSVLVLQLLLFGTPISSTHYSSIPVVTHCPLTVSLLVGTVGINVDY